MPSPRKKFTRYTRGRNQQVIVPKPLALDTSDATLAAFIASAAAGTIGIYKDDGTVISGAIPANTVFSVVLKHTDGSIRKTTPVNWNTVTASKKLYVAPVKCQGYLGWNTTGGGLNLATSVAVGKFYECAVMETTEGNQPFPTWNYEYVAQAGDVEADVIQGLVISINNTANLIYKQNAPIVTAKAKSNATYGNFTLGGTTPTMTFTNGSKVVTFGGTSPVFNGAVGDFLAVDSAAQPTSIVGDTYKIAAVNAVTPTITLNRAYAGATVTLTQAQAQGTRLNKLTAFTATGIEFNGINIQENFQIVARQELKYATLTQRSAYTYGIGIPEVVYEAELEGNTYAGNTAGNTQFGNEGFGNPDRFAWQNNGDSETYDTFMLVANQDITLTAMPGTQKAPEHIIIYAPKSSGGLTASLQTAFNV